MKILILVTFVVTVLIIYSEQSAPICTCVCKDPHKVFSECGSACPEICNTPPKPCILICVQGCFCEKGYVLESNTSDICIRRSRCNYT